MAQNPTHLCVMHKVEGPINNLKPASKMRTGEKPSWGGDSPPSRTTEGEAGVAVEGVRQRASYGLDYVFLGLAIRVYFLKESTAEAELESRPTAHQRV